MGLPSFVKNTGWVATAKVFESLFSYIIIIFIARYLGAEGLGQYSFLFSFVAIFFILSDLGLSSLLVKDLARGVKKIDYYVSNILSVKLLLGGGLFLLFLLTIPFIGKDSLLLALIIVGFIQLLSTIYDVPLGILRASQKGKIIALTNFFERFFALILILFFLPILKNINVLVFILFLSTLLKFLLVFFHVKKYFAYSFILDKLFLKKILAKSLPFMLAGVFSIIFIQMDTVMLSFLKGDVVVGWYQSGYKLINIVNLIPSLFLVFGFPVFSSLYVTQKNNLRRFFETLLNVSLVIMFPLIVLVLFLGGDLLNFIYNFQSIESTISFSILIVAELFIFLTALMGLFIAAVDRQLVFAKIAGVGALINIFLNFMLIPRWSLYGAGVATGLTYLLIFVLMYFFIQREVLKFTFWRFFLLPFVSALIMTFFTWKLVNTNFILNGFLSLLIYCFSMLLLWFFYAKLARKPLNIKNYFVRR